MVLKNHARAPIRKEKLSPSSKARRESSRNKFLEKGGMPDTVKSFRPVDRSKNRSRARPGFVKFIQNEVRKKQNSTKSRPFSAETGWRGEKMELHSKKKSKRDRMMR